MKRTCVAQGSSRKFGVRSAHFTSSHASFSCAHVVCLILRDFSTFLSLLYIFSPIVLHFLLAINFFFHDVEDKFPVHSRWWGPCHPLPSTTLSQVTSPKTTASRRLLNCASRNPPARAGSWTCMTLSTMTTPSARALSSPLFTQEREDAASRRRAYRSHDEGLLSSQSSSVGRRTGRPVADQLDPPTPNVRENPRRGSENEQIRILLERQIEQILADFQAEIQQHELQAD